MALRALLPDDPTTVGPYRLTGRLGAGGMGVVYLGFGDDGEPVAVKTLQVGAEADARLRLRREAEHMAAVDDPRVARLLDSDTDAEVPWLASAYIAGPALSEVKLPLSDMALRGLAEGLAGALRALAAAGIVHRDVKPGNVILGFDGPVLVDLGISRTGVAATTLTQVGIVLGSPVWMPPEQLRGDPIGAATDVWAWGAVLTYAATGRLPFGEGTLEAVAWRVQTADPDLEGLPEWLDAPVRAALQKKAADRPPASKLLSVKAPAATPVVPPPDATRVWHTPAPSPAGQPMAPHVAAGAWPPAAPVAAPTHQPVSGSHPGAYAWQQQPAPLSARTSWPTPVPPAAPVWPGTAWPQQPTPEPYGNRPFRSATARSFSGPVQQRPPQALAAGTGHGRPPWVPAQPDPAAGRAGPSGRRRSWVGWVLRWSLAVVAVVLLTQFLLGYDVFAVRPLAAVVVSVAAVMLAGYLRRYVLRLVFVGLAVAVVGGLLWYLLQR